MDQISIFDFIDESRYLSDSERVFEDVLKRGSNIEGSLSRIKRCINLPLNEFAAFLRHEFNVGGTSYKGYVALWDGKGLKAGTDFDNMKSYTWIDVAKAFKRKYGGEN